MVQPRLRIDIMKSFEAKSYPLKAYPKVRKIDFPKSLPIAYAVCADRCGNRQFIVDGSTQVCEYCGRLMFRTLTQTYSLDSSDLVDGQKANSKRKSRAAKRKPIPRSNVEASGTSRASSAQAPS